MKNFIIIIFIISFSSTLVAQGFEAQLIGGTSFSQIDGDNLAGYNNIGITIGGATNFLLKNGYSFQQEIVYYQRGSRANDVQLFDDNFTYKNLDYIDFNLLFNKQLKEKWEIQLGTGAGKVLRVKSDDPNDKLVYYAIDVFGVLGGGYYFTENLLINVRLQYSVKSAQKNIRWFHNNSMAFTVRWKFMRKD
ncbi:MAG: PorT family protein [Cyclobacteriaceae bacterium]|nr:PorT family protein [Cyclobacteriaceae bacterium]